jgi:hypothetical protein
MSFGNPTQIRPGLTAKFPDHRFTVIGRAVLGMVEAGRNYYWNEFYLEASGGQLATLVFEETGEGGKWRLFSMVEPENPITAQDAASKRTGDSIHFHHAAFFITRVAQSRVYYVEGKAPEGIAVGQVADYFNAQSGQNMVVVSWTGNEVEYYEGATISRGAVASAFGLSGLAAWQFALTGGRRWFNRRVLVPCVVLLFLVTIPATILSNLPSSKRPSPVTVLNAAPSPLSVGASGVLNGVSYRITGHTLVETAEVGLRFQHHEYALHDEDENEALLIQDPRPNAQTWYLGTPLHPQVPLAPRQAGNIRQGQTVEVEGRAVRVSELFRCTIGQAENSSPFNLQPGQVLYGFSGSMGSNLLLVRWNEVDIAYHQLAPLPAQTVSAFKK